MTDFVVAQGNSGTQSTTAASNSTWYIKYNSGLCVIGATRTIARTAATQIVTITLPFTVLNTSPLGLGVSAFHTGDITTVAKYSAVGGSTVDLYIESGTSGGFLQARIVLVGKWK